jgi:hypothetical protein
MRPHHLTPGERQRLALAVALANRPGLLLADEPTSQLDSRARDEVLGALEAVRAAGTTVVVVTHDPSVGLHMGRTVTIRDGRVGAEGRRGEDYAVVGRDGSIHLPADVLKVFAPGTLVEVFLDPDGTARLVPAGSTGGRRRVEGQPEQVYAPPQPASRDYAGPNFSAFGTPEPSYGPASDAVPELSYGAALSASEPAYGGGYGSAGGARGATETAFGSAEAFGAAGRTAGAAEPFGTAEPGRTINPAESSRTFGAAEPGPAFGAAESSRAWGATEPGDMDRRGLEPDDGEPAGPVRRRSGLTFGSSATDGADPFDYWGEER